MVNFVKGLRYIKTLEKCLQFNHGKFFKMLVSVYSQKYYFIIRNDNIYVDRFLNCVHEGLKRNYL